MAVTKRSRAKKAAGKRPARPAKALAAADPIRPLAVLREQITAFDAAFALVLSDPEKRAVHKLRSGTRRVEAQLVLLGLLGHGDELAGKRYRKLLDEVRRACGRARDCDVEIDLLDELTAGLEAGDDGPLRAQSQKLRVSLAARRDRRAADLKDDLAGHARKLPMRLELLLKGLKSAEAETLEPAKLEDLTRRWYAEHADAEAARGSEQAGEDALHEVRKRAKLARFLLESGGDRMAGAAGAFESVQDCGGVWHDLLTLAENARKKLGRKAELSRLLATREEAALTTFREKLRAFGAA